MTLPVRRHRGGLAERGFPAWRDPLLEFDDLFNRMGSLLESAVGGVAPSGAMAWSPLADVSETDEAYLIDIDLPGIKRDDIDVELSGRELIITGELQERARTGILRSQMRRTGRCEFRTLLPSDVDAEKVSAKLADGVLTVTVPKQEAVKPHHIEITAEG